jgi:RNA polymerase sigma-70 factor (ECF subfamily)
VPGPSSSQHEGDAAASAVVADESALVRALREGDEATFARLVEAWGPLMLRMALVHVPSQAVAEEVVQEAWLTVLRDIDRFERRSALRTWLLGIVVNLARSRGRAERRCMPLSGVVGDDAGAVYESSRFYSRSDPWAHHWAIGPTPWPTPEQELLAGETREVVLGAIAALPPAHREVLVLRDLEGWSARETCNVLALSDTNQRVLLHRARSRVRRAIEDYFQAAEPT